MNKLKLRISRPELTIAEVIEKYDCRVDDLFHAAANNELRIYVLADSWGTEAILDIDRVRIDADLTGLHTLKEIESDNLYGWKNPESVPSSSKFIKQEFRPDMLISGNSIEYKTTEANKELYELYWSGFQPIARDTFKSHREGDERASILLNVSAGFDDLAGTVERLVYPSPSIYLPEALKASKLFVMKADLESLSANDLANPDDTKSAGGVTRNTLLKLVIGMAVGGYTYKPTANKNVAGSDIKKDLEQLGIGLDDDTIRKALKEAEKQIPLV